MKNLKNLIIAVLMISPLTFIGSGMASLDSIAAGAACKTYYPNQKLNLRPDWSSVNSTANTWVHCPAIGGSVAAGNVVIFNLDIPISAEKHIFNCYIATQNATADSSTKEVIWIIGSGVGPVVVEIGDTGGGAPTGSILVDENKTLTTGCYLYTAHSLYSIGRQ